MVSIIRRYSTNSLGILRKNCSTQTIKPIQEIPKSKTTTVDPIDIKHHEEWQNNWWSLNGPVRALHSMNVLRVQLIRDGLANVDWKDVNSGQPLEGIKILDVGCGGGILSEPLSRIGATVTGLDASPKLIETAKFHATLDPSLSGRINYVNSSIENYIKTNSGIYDAVVASEIVEHVNDQEFFLQCCVQSLKPGGSIFVTTINKTIPSFIGGIVAAEYLLKLLPIGTHNWNKFISPDEIQRSLEKYGCRTKLVHGMFYNPMTNRWSWIPSTAINYAIHAVKVDEEEK